MEQKNVSSVKKSLTPTNRSKVKKELAAIVKTVKTTNVVTTSYTLDDFGNIIKAKKPMEANSKYTEYEVLKSLTRKGFEVKGKQLITPSFNDPKNVLGIKSRGKISFLLNYCGYYLTTRN
jgi:hypothetical protein